MKSVRTFATRLHILPVLIAAGLVASISHASTLDSMIANQAHRLIIGDYNGDGAADLLLQGRPEDEHAQVLSGVTNASVQRWRDGFLGLTWNRHDTQLVVGDFDGNASSDILIQATTPASVSEVILSSEDGQLETSRQTLGDYHLGLRWDALHHTLVVGDFNGDSRDDVFLQGRQNDYRHAVALSAAAGTFEALALDFDNTHLNIDWVAGQHQLVAGDFDGNGASELLLQPHHGDALYRVTSGEALLDTAMPMPADLLGLDWHASAHRLVVGDFTGDGRDDVFLLAARAELLSALVPSDTEGFVRIERELRDIPHLDQLRQILVGDFDADGIDDLVLLYTNPDHAPLLLLADESRRQRLDQALRRLSLLRANQSLQVLHGTSPTGHDGTDAAVIDTQTGAIVPGAMTRSAIVTEATSTNASGAALEGATTSSKTISTVNAVGSLVGEGGVSGGAASYTIPIAVPPGRHGMQPAVSLSYSSRAGNGVAGMGWSLDAGQSSIQRCARTVAQDGYPRPVKGDAQDQLCLDGQRLLQYSGTYGNSGSTYRTEQESFVRVTQNGSLATATFTVELTDGGKRTYGQRVTPTGSSFVASWLLTESADAYGNTIKYEYTLYADAEWLLTKIIYTGRKSPVTLGNREVRFQYATRSDTSASYYANGFSRQTMLLTGIQTYAPRAPGATAEKVREYTLSHISSDATGRSLLEWVQECAFKNGARSCLPETRFTWNHAKPSFVLEKLGSQVNAAGILQNKRYIEDVLPRGDSNGDGVPDLPGYYLDAEGRQRGTNPNPVQKCATNYHLRGTRCFSADFNNDGLTDSWRHDGTLRIAYTVAGGSAGVEFNTGIALPTPIDGERQSDHLHAVADLNGDGWKDLVVYHNTSSGARLVAYYHTGNTNAPYPSAASKVLYNWDFARVAAGAQRVPTIEATLAEDFDGNGLPDIVITQVFKTINGVNASIPAGLPKSIVFLHADAAHNLTGNEQTLASLVPPGETPYLGNIATPPAFSTYEHYFNYFIDVNGDGLSDWLGIQGGNLYVRVNTGGRFKSWHLLGEAPAGLKLTQTQNYYYEDGSEIAIMKWPAYDRYLRQMDINADGKMELLVPGTRKVSACYQILEATSPSSGAWVDKCDAALYGTYQQTFYGLPQPITQPNRDAGVVEFDAISFGLDTAGNPTSSNQASGLLGSIGESAALDVFGKGLPDLVTTVGCGSTLCSMGSFSQEVKDLGLSGPGVYINRNRGSAGPGQAYRAVDTLTKVQEGLGRQTEWVLKPLSTGDYAGGVCNGGASMPSLYQTDFGYLAGSTPGQYFHFASSVYVVAELKRSNGVGGMNSTRYRYRGAVFDGWGRGFQGFREIITDEDRATSGLRSCSTFSQLFPYSGQVTAVTVQTYAGQKLSQTTNSLALSRPFPDNRTYLPYVETSEVERWDLNGSWLGKTTTELTTLDDYGNTTDSITTVDDAYLTRTQRTVSAFTVSVASWWLNRRDRDTVTAKVYEKTAPRSATHDVPQTRITAYAYTGERQPDLVTREPDNPALRLETDFDYDGYGNVSKTTVSGGSGETLVNARANSVVYDSEGYFPDYLLNALNHVTDVLYDGTIGKLTESEDPLGNQNKLTYDAFARAISQQLLGALTARTATTTVYSADFTGDSAKPALAQYKTITSQPGVRPTVVTYFDGFNRVLRVQTDNPVNPTQKIWQDSVYDADGHLSKQSVPYFSTDTLSSCQWTEYLDFDLANRPTQRKLPNDNGCQLTITYSYNGAQTGIQVGPNSSYQVSRVQNALGQWWKTTDQGSESGYGNGAVLTTHFRYDAFGNPVLISRTPSGGSEIKNTASYNALGHKTSMTDPDRGTWTFSHNVLGELVKQVDAKQQHSYWDFDVLGRMTARYEAPNSTTAKTLVAQSVFDGPCLNNGAAAKGLPCSSRKVGETSKAFTYTLEGLLEQTITTLTASGEASKSFTVNQAYDGEGRPNLLTYPSTSLADN
ncbi:MAG: SpvB/TcaC N-terminal domain-containing protein, partial [Permianibacter sp.]